MHRGGEGTGQVPGSARRRWPVTVAIVGADGSGKTSVAQALLESGTVPMKYLYLGPALGSSSHALPTSRLINWLRRRKVRSLISADKGMPPDELMTEQMRKRLHRGPVLKALGMLNRVAEEWYRQCVAWAYRLRGYHVLCDRHFLFEWCPDSPSSRNPDAPLTDRLHDWLLRRFYPEPAIVMFLDAPAAVLHARKPEWTPEYLDQQRTRILEQGRHTGNFVIVDATQPFSDVLAEVTRLVIATTRGQPAAADG